MKTALLAGAFACSLAFAGCTSQDQQNALAAINTACILLPIGASIAVNVASGGATVGTISNVITQAGPAVCSAVISGVEQAIAAAGGNAVVTVTTTPPAKSGMRRMVRKVIVTPSSVTSYIVTSGGLIPGF